MGLAQITSIVILIGQFSVFSLAADLPKLPNNRLSEGQDRDLPNGVPIHCGSASPRRVSTTTYKNPGQVLTSTIFGRDAITAGALGDPNGPRPGAGTRYKMAEFHGAKVLYALEIDPAGEAAYWLPQGGVVDIHHHPSDRQPKYVFTPDFSGCSWTVTPGSNGMLRLHHVEGGREREQFNSLTEAQKGGPITYAIQYKDYGYVVETRKLTSNVPAYAYMHYANGHWTLNFQRKSCTPETGGYTFNSARILTGLVMNESKSTYPAISGTKSYNIP
ncbi:uncharacterized protein LOC125229461 [Leguminivora glycinivorella]|uniref:uncharacterized protein LOC125229461 n=1 Tax=Leguminivora glycinivorella TaxID=1035111 RepID=UPI00200BD0A5|nr:uncharacterized protein LOC125229461 [Leguminivora glycinivorella]